MTGMGTKLNILTWVVRIAFAAVFAVNVQCAVTFLLTPGDYVSGFMLASTGPVGETAVAGLGVAFLMWNATYPAFIVAPRKFPEMGWVIIAQQVIGLLGEAYLYFGLDSGFETLRATLLRFIAFDAVGLFLMLVAMILFTLALYCAKVRKSDS